MDILRWLLGDASREKNPPRCFGCGECCESFGGHLRASKPDLERWRRLGRKDLLSRVNRLGWIWTDPRTGRPEKKCPFLERTAPDAAHCGIHEIKPDICRAYPTLAHGNRCLRGVFLRSFPGVWQALGLTTLPVIGGWLPVV